LSPFHKLKRRRVTLAVNILLATFPLVEFIGRLRVHQASCWPQAKKIIASSVYLALTTLRLCHELNTSLRNFSQSSPGGVGVMLETAVADAGRLHHCPHCRSRRSLRNVYRCGDRHLFCEECSVPILRGAMRALTTTCPRCGKETADTVGFIEQSSIRSAPLSVMNSVILES